MVAVHNGGEPIAGELLVNIFEPLRRGDAQNLGKDSFSMGLGLYIASTIALAHQGTLTVESTREHGTTFTAKLPIAAVA